MDFNTFTINGITKIYDDRIICRINEKDKNENISLIQWLPFQFEFVFKVLKMSTSEKFPPRKYTMKQMGDILKDLFPDGLDLDIDNENELKDMGLFKYNIKDEITPLNLGGFANFIPKTDINTAYIINPSNKDEKYFTKKDNLNNNVY